MLALRYAYVFALAVWLGGMVVLGALVAPTTFELLPAAVPDSGRVVAGALFGTTFSRFHLLEYACGTVLILSLTSMALLGPRPTGFAVRLAVAGVMLAATLYSGLVVLTELSQIQQQAGTLPSRLPADDARRIRFDSLHQLSSRLMMLNLAGALILLYWEARDHGR